MKKNILIIGILCEIFSCLYVPMNVLSNRYVKFLGYNWLWAKETDGYYSSPDVKRLLIGMLIIGLLTFLFYLISPKPKK